MRECKKLNYTLSNGKHLEFINYSLKKPYRTASSKNHKIPETLESCLSDPRDLSYSPKSIFLGWGSATPSLLSDSSPALLYPVWMPLDWLYSSNQLNLLIAGQTGSGKTSLLYRIIAASAKELGSVIIGEVKKDAFRNFSNYLSYFCGIPNYRWPNGNCWFNPLLKLKTREQRRIFAETLLSPLEIDGELKIVAEKVADIIAIIIEFLSFFSHQCTIRNLSYFLKRPEELNQVFERQDIKEPMREHFKRELERLDFFRQNESAFIATRLVISKLTNALENSSNFLKYTEPPSQSTNLVELDIKKHVIEERAILTVSQPLAEAISAGFAGLIWNLIYDEIITLGRKPNRPQTQTLVCFIDEAAKLSSGKLGDSTDTIREYGVGLVEVYPMLDSSKDSEVFNRRIQTFGTFLSLHPALDPMAQYLFDHRRIDQTESLNLVPRINHDFDLGIGMEYSAIPDSMPQDFKQTGERTLLLHNKMKAETFWVDMSCSLMPHIGDLLEEFQKTQKKTVSKLIAYALGLVTEIS